MGVTNTQLRHAQAQEWLLETGRAGEAVARPGAAHCARKWPPVRVVKP